MNQFGGSRTDTLVKLVLIFFISLLSFSVGTFIGKTVTEKQYKDTMYEPTGEEVEQASNEEDSKDAIDDEALSLTDEFAKIKKETKEKERNVASEEAKAQAAGHDDHHAAEAPKMATVKPEAKKAEKKTEKIDMHGSNNAHHGMDAAARVAVGKPPTDAHKPTTTKASTLPTDVGSTTTGKYTIQIASYAKEDEANKHSANLNSQGFSAFVVPAQIKGQTWYRVSVGQFPTQAEAVGYKDEFVKKSNISKVIIQKIAQ